MIPHSAEYDKAVVADSRRQYVRTVFDLLDPDAVMGAVTSNNESKYSKTAQVIDRGAPVSLPKYSTLEPNRWLLDGSWDIYPDNPEEITAHAGWISNTLSDDNGSFAEPYPYVQAEFSGIEVLQAATLQFDLYEPDGVPEDFTVTLYSGEQVLESRDVVGNAATSLVIEGFEVNYPTAIRLTVKKWSKPRRRVRISRVMVGLYETWDTTVIRDVDIYTESTFSGLAIPYSSCSITVDNVDKRFDPYAPNSIFKSIEERQSIPVELGMRLEDGSIEWLPGGTYYQKSGGWKLNDLTVQWDLLDMIGMLVNRRFVVPGSLPTTLGGWVQALVSSMGVNFADRYIVDSDVSGMALTATREAVEGKFCGELLRYMCMATNTWPRQDMKTGELRVGKLERIEGNKVTLDNMPEYATMEANDDIADITFTLDEGEVTFPGTNTDSDTSLSVNNPFVHTADDARKAVISCLFEYGGKHFTVRSRGNPSSETGDLMSIATQFGTDIAARLYKQQLKLEQGVMHNMPSYLVQSPNDSVYANKVVLTGAGQWESPIDGTVKVTLIGGGQGGQGGFGGIQLEVSGEEFSLDNTSSLEGSKGGYGGLIFISEISASASQVFNYYCGKGGKGGEGGQEDVTYPDEPEQFASNGLPGDAGEPTTFGQLTSANGKSYPVGLMDIQSGTIYGASGPSSGGKVTGSYGCGGAGGIQGKNGAYEVRKFGTTTDEGPVYYRPYRLVKATPGTDGGPGKLGCIILEW